ncbi:ABC transporter ATP-binding protein [Streptomyces sp. NPDC057950]|uniref:ABC transporter ATP-binding protein n=1 Tax=Streptomyces sp. NPDC057950 TaxID=3346288 RepID=UPI0036E5C96E
MSAWVRTAGPVPGAVPETAVRLDKVTRTYGRGAGAVHALHDVSAAFARGTFTAVMGPSGSGKSTLLHCAAGLDRPTAGSVHLGTADLVRMSETQLARLRRERVGFVFQAFNLLPSLTVAQNITLPLRLAGRRPDRAWLTEITTRVGLADRTKRRPAELSGGQQQRVAIARALVTRPDVIFADEPTGALDPDTARDILGLLRTAVTDLGQTVVMVTHDPVAAAHTDAALFLSGGRIAGHLAAPTADEVTRRLSGLWSAA